MRAALLAFVPFLLAAQEPPEIQVNPNRPSFANPATTTMPGVAELEFGLQRTEFRDGSRSDYEPTLLKLGMSDDFELRFQWNGWQKNTDATGASQTGPTDPGFGFTWRLFKQDAVGADLALSYDHQVPMASVEKGIGTGRVSDTLVALASKDFGKLHADFNLIDSWVGLPQGGRAQQPAAALALTHPIAGPWSFGGELYAIGGGAAGPSDVATLWNLAYQVSPRLVLDAGFDHGLTGSSPRWNYFVGLTWGIGRFRSPR